jgi:hypothetical protein
METAMQNVNVAQIRPLVSLLILIYIKRFTAHAYERAQLHNPCHSIQTKRREEIKRAE